MTGEQSFNIIESTENDEHISWYIEEWNTKVTLHQGTDGKCVIEINGHKQLEVFFKSDSVS